MRFEGKTAVVTGAGSGIGRVVAQRFVDEGATVFGLDINVQNVPHGVLPLQADISNEEQVNAAIDRATQETGQIDVLCNLAGIVVEGDILDTTCDDWERSFAINVKGVFLATRAALKNMVGAGRGVIINAGSSAAHLGLPNRASYCAAKGAVEALTRQVAVAYAGTGVRCNAVTPGPVDTPLVQAFFNKAADPEAARAASGARVPLNRLAQPEEIANAILFLASDEASYVTGESLRVDGGQIIV
jgi:NAD(P)-dependent dehydrogenase (short-subunit alcohol dehydrogenase family)